MLWLAAGSCPLRHGHELAEEEAGRGTVWHQEEESWQAASRECPYSYFPAAGPPFTSHPEEVLVQSDLVDIRGIWLFTDLI